MTKHNFMYRPGLCAIAAFAALGATPLMAQAADPLAPSVDSTPVITSTPVVAAPDPVAGPTADPLAAATPAIAAPKAKPIAAKTTRTAIRTITARTAAPVRTAAPARAIAPVAVAAAAPLIAAPASVAPIVDPAPLPAEFAVATAPAPVPVSDSGLPADALPIGAAGLGALALAGAALAMRRRKRRVAEEEFDTTYEEPAFASVDPVAVEPMASPIVQERTPIADDRPIMAWGSTAAAAPVVAASAEGHGEVPDNVDPASHVAAAYRGPSAENPSLSLKTRLKRAAFFDQRERQAAAGEAAPLDMTAGLPDAVIDDATDSVGEVAPKFSAPQSTGGSYSLRPTFEPA